MDFFRLTWSQPGMVSWLFAGLTVALVLAGSWCLWNGARSRRWPVVRGTILLADVKIRGTEPTAADDMSGFQYHAEVRYRYQAGGRDFNGNRVYFGQGLFGSGSAEESIRLTQRYRPGKEVNVYVHERNPRLCVLEPAMRGKPWCALILGLGIILIFALFGKRTP